MTSRVLGQSLDLYHIYIIYIYISKSSFFSWESSQFWGCEYCDASGSQKKNRHPTWDVGIGESRSKTETIKWTWVQSQAESTTEAAAVPSSPEKCWSNFKLGGYERPSQSRPRWHSPTGSGKKQVPLIGNRITRWRWVEGRHVDAPPFFGTLAMFIFSDDIFPHHSYSRISKDLWLNVTRKYQRFLRSLSYWIATEMPHVETQH